MGVIGSLIYGGGRFLFRLVFQGVFHTRMRGRDRVPRRGGLLVVSNHISFVDPPLVATVLPRRLAFMAMVELFRKPVLGAVMRAIRAIPVDRSRNDHNAARQAIRRLRAGDCVLIFPEGGIRVTEKSVLGGDPTFRPGAAAIALLGGAAIQPVVVRDTRQPYQWRNWLPFARGTWRRATMSVTFGHPFCLWNPETVPAEERRQLARQTLREQLLKTVELG